MGSAGSAGVRALLGNAELGCVTAFKYVGFHFNYQASLVPSTNGEGSLIISGRFPVAEGRSLLCDIKISLGLLHHECHGSLDLGEIYQYRPSECCAFDLRILTFAYSGGKSRWEPPNSA